MPDSNDDALMQSVARNEEGAFRTLMQRHQPWVFSLLVAIVRNQQHAEDLTQEVFLRARQHAGKYTSQGEFASWLKRIAINSATDFLRKNRKFIAVGLEDIEKALADERWSSPVAALLTSTLREEVRTAIQSLSKMESWMTCHEFADVYNRMLQSAKENHPRTELDRLGPLKVPTFGASLVGNINYPAEMRIRISELRIVLEALQTDNDKAKK